jgi:hypothetical protein
MFDTANNAATCGRIYQDFAQLYYIMAWAVGKKLGLETDENPAAL